MIKIEFNNTKLSVPESWKDIKLADYEKWYMQQPESKAEYVRFVADVCNIDHELLMNSPTTLFDIITNTISFVFAHDIAPGSNADIDGERYYVSYGDKLTLGEWVDVESVLSGKSDSQLSEMLAILCRPAGEGYNPGLNELRQELFRRQSCDRILPLIAFFLCRKKKLDAISNHYSEAIVQANQFVRDIDRFVTNGDGIKQLPIWQRIRFTYLMRSLKKQLSKFSDFSSIA